MLLHEMFSKTETGFSHILGKKTRERGVNDQVVNLVSNSTNDTLINIYWLSQDSVPGIQDLP